MPDLALRSSAPIAVRGRSRARQRWAESVRIFVDGRIGVAGVALLVLVGLFALAHPLLLATVWDPQIYDPIGGFTRDTALPAAPSWAHPLGLSRFGRDVLSQLMYSVRVAFGLGVLAAAISVTVGTVVGCLAAFYRDTFVDTFFMRLANFFMISRRSRCSSRCRGSRPSTLRDWQSSSD